MINELQSIVASQDALICDLGGFGVLDDDQDGVVNCQDQQKNTRSGVPVDGNGIMLNPIYLHENGITIKSQEWGLVGDIGNIGAVSYTHLTLPTIYSV